MCVYQFCVYYICMNASICMIQYVSECMCTCTSLWANLICTVCGCCQKKLTGDEGWRESETHWAGNGV